jgi:hypothetical protein
MKIYNPKLVVTIITSSICYNESHVKFLLVATVLKLVLGGFVPIYVVFLETFKFVAILLKNTRRTSNCYYYNIQLHIHKANTYSFKGARGSAVG